MDFAGDVDLMEELLSGDFWLGNPDYLDLLPEPTTPPPSELQIELDNNSNNQEEERFELANRSLAPIVPLKERLCHALSRIDSQRRESDVLIQIWVPTRIAGRDVLTTCDQPFWLDQGCRNLSSYRSASLGYRFSATEDPGQTQTLGLPGRVFTGRVPEWTPDVRYFSTSEYPRVGHAQRCDVRGTVALPVFERGGRSCVAVVEVVSTAQKINYSSDVESICSALQAVDLRSSDVRDAYCIKESNNSYQAALPEILNVLRVVCDTHRLPLAQTWIPCIQQGKQGSRHSEENYRDCVSTVDNACYVKEASVLGFHKACSEYHLFKGQGVVGEAFRTNQPCFWPDITSIIKAKYPLSHHAKLFCLRGAVAIRLRSILSGNADFVLEFFLPTDCEGSEEQKLMLNSLSVTIQQVCQGLRVVTAKELEDETVLQPNESLPSDILLDEYVSEGGQRPDMETTLGYFPSVEVTGEVPSWVASIMEAEEKEETSMLPSSSPLESSKRDGGEFNDTTNWEPPKDLFPDEKISSRPEQLRQDIGKDTNDHMDSLPSEPNFSNAGKTTEKRRAKMEKTVSLQVLRQYFAGSLKDAAKGIGVCPTTLKRICRQHGINRWPSRKIKKVGHSLKKLQVVIDSVQGAKGTFQFSSLYENFAKSPAPNEGSTILSTLKPTDHPESSKALQQQEEIFNFHTSTSNSLSSSCSHSSSSSLGCSSGSKQGVHTPQIAIKQETPIEEKRTIKLKRVHSNVELQFSTPGPLETLARSVSHDILAEKLSLGKPSQPQKETGLLKVKAIYGEEKVRFRLQLGWGFQELKQEIIKRFNISDLSSVNLKYLDDDSEWVLLTCDDDLQECIDVYKTSSSDTIRISVHRLPTGDSFTLPGLS